MKTNTRITLICATGILGAAALTSNARPPVFFVPLPPPPIVVAPPPPPPVVVVQPLAPAVTVNVGVPDAYVWDGDEYVGVIGDQYYYLGPGNVWLPLTSDRLVFFHDWEKHNKNWMKHAIRNEKYRRDAGGHEHPLKYDHDSGH
jgi:hypothetical protein